MPAMPRIQCKKCGKVSEVAAEDAGGIFVCAACGMRNDGPLAEKDGQAWAAMRKAVEKDAKRWKKGAKGNPTEELEAHVGTLAREVPVMPAIVSNTAKAAGE